MKKNLRIKFLIIAGIVLACIYGIIGLPTSKAQLVDNWNRNIHLGLDLRGGTYLVVQVQEQDAFNSEANTQADQIRESARKVNINLGEVEVQEAKTLADASVLIEFGVGNRNGQSSLPRVGVRGAREYKPPNDH